MTNDDHVIDIPITALSAPISSDPLAKLSAATRALSEARDISEIKQIMDIAEAARTYARAAKLGLEAANHAAEVKLRAERKAGELLQQLERGQGQGNQYTASFQNGTKQSSEYREVLTDNDIAQTTAHRWQTVATVPEDIFEQRITEIKERQDEVTTASMLRLAEELKRPHVSNNSGQNEWYTPVEFIESARMVMGCIDLDPASSDAANQIVQATTHFTVEKDGLSQHWAGRVWMNPPYSSDLIGRFVNKLVWHVTQYDVPEAIVLVNNATETEWFLSLTGEASAVVFPSKRVRFWQPDGALGQPLQGQAILYIGTQEDRFLLEFSRFGWGATLYE